MKWIIDTDPGVDDAAAIILANKLNVDLLGISVVHGNVSLKQAVTNALRLKDLLKSDTPVYKGSERPLLQSRIDAKEVHGSDGLGDMEWPEVSAKVEKEHAVEMIIEASKKYEGELGILAIGPLTNLALAIALDRNITGRINQVVIMGGNSKGQGNTTMVGEFNFLADPEAAAIVLDSGMNITLVPWETTVECLIPESYLTDIQDEDPLISRFFGMTRPVTGIIKTLTGKEGFILPDLVAAGVAFEKSLATRTREVYATVETGGRVSRGLTAIDYWATTGKPANIKLCLGVDLDGLVDLFFKALRS